MQFTQELTIVVDPEIVDSLAIGDRFGFIEAITNVSISGTVRELKTVGTKTKATLQILGRVYQWKS